MRNPGLRFVGITSSPVGVGVFGNRAEEELRLWLESRLDALGIDPVAYTRCVLSLLRRPDSALSPGPDLPGTKTRAQGKYYNKQQQQRTKTKLYQQQGEREHKRAVVQCLTNASDQTSCGVESLVDELCAKLRDLEGSNNNNNNNNIDDNKINCHSIENNTNNIETLTSRDKVLRYYAAFPALQPSTPKKVTQKKAINNSNKIISNNNSTSSSISNLKKYRNIGINGKNNNKNSNDKHNNSNNNNNININNNNNNNYNNNNNQHHKGRQAKKTKMSIQVIDTRKIEEKETFGFAKSLEREREKELDDLRLAQLQAKFDESLEALWDSGAGNSNDKSSIWAAPSLSIPSGPHWPINTDELPLTLTTAATKTPYDEPQMIPWNIDLIGIGKYTTDDNKKNDKKLNYNFNWSNNIDNDAPWSLKDIGNNLINMEKGLKTTGCFIPIPPNSKNIIIDNKKSSIVHDDKGKTNEKIHDNNNDDDEDLLTSNKTHFRPIKDDGNWADGTTFPVNNHFERVAYRRSNSKNLLYLPGGESPYMEYKDNTSTSSSSSSPASSSNGNNHFTLKFRVRQCDKSIQTDPIRSPVKRRIINDKNHFYYPSINDILNDDDMDDDNDEHDEDGKDSSFMIGPLGWIKPSVTLISDRKRRHSSNFKCRPLAALRPLTL